MKTISLLEKIISQLAEDYCECECSDCPKYVGCAVLEAKNYLEEELGFGEDE